MRGDTTGIQKKKTCSNHIFEINYERKNTKFSLKSYKKTDERVTVTRALRDWTALLSRVTLRDRSIKGQNPSRGVLVGRSCLAPARTFSRR